MAFLLAVFCDVEVEKNGKFYLTNYQLMIKMFEGISLWK